LSPEPTTLLQGTFVLHGEMPGIESNSQSKPNDGTAFGGAIGQALETS